MTGLIGDSESILVFRPEFLRAAARTALFPGLWLRCSRAPSEAYFPGGLAEGISSCLQLSKNDKNSTNLCRNCGSSLYFIGLSPQHRPFRGMGPLTGVFAGFPA